MNHLIRATVCASLLLGCGRIGFEDAAPEPRVGDATVDAQGDGRALDGDVMFGDTAVVDDGATTLDAQADANTPGDASADAQSDASVDAGNMYRTECEGLPQITPGDCDALYAFRESTRGLEGVWTGTDPCAWRGVACTTRRVTALVPSGQTIRGTLPAEIGQLTACTTMGLGGNSLGGEIPLSIMNLPDNVQLSLSGFGCFSATDPVLRAWLDEKDPEWMHNGAGGPDFCLT